MGCFNRTGFISHLPIKYGDEIVVFLMADTSKILGVSPLPISITGGGYTPLCLPFFGTYDDYGSIENVVNDFNAQYFQNTVGISIESFLKKLFDCEGMSLNKIADKIEELENKTFEEFTKKEIIEWEKKHNMEEISYLREMSEYFKRILNIKIEGLGKEELKLFVNYQKQEFYDSSIVFTMEHKSVYDKMAELGRSHFYEDFWKTPKYTIEETFDNTNKFIQIVGEKMKDVNPFTFGLYLSRLITKIADIDEKNDDIFDPISWFSYYTLLNDTVYCGTLDYRLYFGCQQDISEMKDDAIKYAYFLRTMRHMCVVFALSPYHNQTIDYTRIVPLYQFMSDFITKEKEKYDSED